MEVLQAIIAWIRGRLGQFGSRRLYFGGAAALLGVYLLLNPDLWFLGGAVALGLAGLARLPD